MYLYSSSIVESLRWAATGAAVIAPAIVLSIAMLPLGAPSALAIEVVEGQPTVVTGAQSAGSASSNGQAVSSNTYSTASASNNSGSAELYVQLQALQVEMSELRGLVEQQAYLIEQLSQRRMDDYLDLDRRLGELQAMQRGSAPRSSATKKPVSSTEKVLEPVTSTVTAQVPASMRSSATGGSASRVLDGVAKPPAVPNAEDADEARDVYQAAYQQVKDREFAKAKVSLALFIKNYPASRYVPNAHFWLGELYYLDSNLEQSRDAFMALVSDHAEHRKVAEAKFKLGKIYHQLGKNDDAKQILQSVITDHPDSKAVNPAREYLKNSL